MNKAIDLIQIALLKTNPSAFVSMIEKRDDCKIQAFTFDKNKFTDTSAADWAKIHKFKSDVIGVNKNNIRIEQTEFSDIKTNVIKGLATGVNCVFGIKKSLMDEFRDGKLTKENDRSSTEQTEKPKASIFKKELAKQIVYGVILEPWTDVTPEGDAHGDRMKKLEIEKSAHGFMEEFQKIKEQHGKEISAKPIESFIAPCDYVAPDGVIVKEGSWVMAVKIQDKTVWEKVLKGEITAFSPGGFGERIPINEESI